MLFGRRKDSTRERAHRPSLRHWRLSAKLLIASSVATVIGFSAICANVMLDMRRGEENLARQSLENLATGIDADISRNIEVYDLSLRAVASNMVMPDIKDVSKPILQVNPHAALISRLCELTHNSDNDDFIRDCGRQLFTNAQLLDGLNPDPQAAAARMLHFMEDLARSISAISVWLR